jgi:rod shape-determining protein MreD
MSTRAWTTAVTVVVLFYLAAALQQSIAYRMGVFGTRPDFLLVALSALSLMGTRRQSVWYGFVAGLLMGSISGANLGQYVASRTVAGLLFGWATVLDFQAGWITTFLGAAGVTLVAQFSLMLLAPPSGIGGFVADTIRMAMYNGVLAMPVYALLRRIVPPTGR